MSGTRPPSPSPAEHHLGDRLAALVDGELGHDARERVLAHLATCARCKAEADAQRALKSVFASSGAPQPSEGFLARLQGLPGGPGGPGDPGRSPLEQLLEAGGVRSDGFATAAPVAPDTSTGFRVHAVAPSGRGRRFAVAAAGAVSFAAIALGGTLPVESSLTTTARGGPGTGSAVTPLRAGASAGPAGSATGRSDRSERPTGGAQSIGSAPLVPGGTVPTGAVPADVDRAGPVTAVRLRAAQTQSLFALSPFIRPTAPALQLAFGPAPSPAPSPPGTPPGSHR
ncbi:zf-HC2 domain-containing protein [Streptomyces roseofulvus]|uniref:Zf-HC2 domain-containing protein n=2 Tax=Streptomyces TaxID=1883 RepID=A0ABU4KER0_9ACTN|nr:zf-HC2 domain-containing protein [Streptomyces roseolus]MDX2296265.1 zf-HC2 domain-containing protein [Streptomyces roseolus]